MATAEFPITEECAHMIRGWNPRQAIFFVISKQGRIGAGSSKYAVAVEWHIGKDTAQRAARRIGGQVRLGLLVDGKAVVA